MDRHGNEQRVLGFIRGEVEEYELDGNPHLWNTELYEERDGVWIKGATTCLKPTTASKGLQRNSFDYGNGRMDLVGGTGEKEDHTRLY